MKIKGIPALFACYAGALILVSWWPYNFAIRPSGIANFEWPLFSELSPEFWGDGKSYVLKIVTYIPLGILLAVAAELPVRILHVAGRAIVAAWTLNLIIQIGWFYLPRRTVGGTDLVLASIGTLVGISPLWFRYLWRRLLWGLTALYAISFLVAATWPWQFTLEKSGLRWLWHRIEWVPFNGRLFKMWVVKEGALNSLMTVPLGLLFASYVLRGGGRQRDALAGAAMLGFSCSLTVEIMQCFLPRRTPSTSDLILNTLGAVAGAAIAYYLDRWHSHAHPNPAAATGVR